MKSPIKPLLALLSLTFSTSLFALDCKDMLGTWTGNLGTLTGVALSIHPSDGVEDAIVSFKASNGAKLTYGMLTGKCEKQADGSFAINLNRNAFSVNAAISATLASENQLQLTKFEYSDPYQRGSASGTLTKAK